MKHWQRAYLRALARCGERMRAARAARISYWSVRLRRQRDESFRREEADAIAAYAEDRAQIAEVTVAHSRAAS